MSSLLVLNWKLLPELTPTVYIFLNPLFKVSICYRVLLTSFVNYYPVFNFSSTRLFNFQYTKQLGGTTKIFTLDNGFLYLKTEENLPFVYIVQTEVVTSVCYRRGKTTPDTRGESGVGCTERIPCRTRTLGNSNTWDRVFQKLVKSTGVETFSP